MNRREALKATISAAAVTAVLRCDSLAAQDAAAKPVTTGTNTLHVNPGGGVDTNAGTKESPLRTLAEAARRVNKSTGTGGVTILLAEGVYTIGETTLLKPEGRTFSDTARLIIRAEVLPDDPDWHIGRMPTLVHAR